MVVPALLQLPQPKKTIERNPGKIYHEIGHLGRVILAMTNQIVGGFRDNCKIDFREEIHSAPYGP